VPAAASVAVALLGAAREDLRRLGEVAARAKSRYLHSAPLAEALRVEVAKELGRMEAAQFALLERRRHACDAGGAGDEAEVPRGATVSEAALIRKIEELRSAAVEALDLLEDALCADVSTATDTSSLDATPAWVPHTPSPHTPARPEPQAEPSQFVAASPVTPEPFRRRYCLPGMDAAWSSELMAPRAAPPAQLFSRHPHGLASPMVGLEAAALSPPRPIRPSAMGMSSLPSMSPGGLSPAILKEELGELVGSMRQALREIHYLRRARAPLLTTGTPFVSY